MAEKGPGSTGRTQQKRLARAKIKSNDNGIKSSKGRAAVDERVKAMEEAEAKKARKNKITGIAVGVFAVILALSMMLPSFAYIFGNNNQSAQDQAAQEQEAKKDEESKDESSSEESTDTQEAQATGIEAIDNNYKAVVDPLEKKLEKNPKDLATLLNLGNDYMSWASEASSYAVDEDASNHVNELFQKAIGYYDQYLELNDSQVVKTSRAMCFFSLGDTDTAMSELQTLTESSPDYGPAWAYIGLINESKGDTDAAKEAYNKAIEVDPDNEYGANSYANRRLAAMAASQGEGLTDEAAESVQGGEATTGAEALEDALNSGL